jgi:hypothetical protein
MVFEFEYIIEFSLFSLCSCRKIVILLDALQILRCFVGTLRYLKTKLFILMVFHADAFMLIVFSMKIYIQMFLPTASWLDKLHLLTFRYFLNDTTCLLLFLFVCACLFRSFAGAYFMIGLWVVE